MNRGGQKWPSFSFNSWRKKKMKGKLILKDENNHFITAEINIEMKDTEGLYSNGSQDIMDFDVVGIQWLPEEKPSVCDLPQNIFITVNCGIDAASVKEARAELKKIIKMAKAGRAG